MNFIIVLIVLIILIIPIVILIFDNSNFCVCYGCNSKLKQNNRLDYFVKIQKVNNQCLFFPLCKNCYEKLIIQKNKKEKIEL